MLNQAPEPAALKAQGLRRLLNPALVTLLGLALLLVAVIASAGGDPLALARLGTRYSQGDPAGSEGYDGQFIYYIALNPAPQAAAPYLDVPAYRYQRILMPLLARGLSLGNPALIPWVLALIGLISQAAGTWCVARLLVSWGASQWYALVYGFWVGFVLAARLDLPEPLAYALVAGAILATLSGRRRLGWLLYALALFAREVSLLFVLAQLAADLLNRRWRDVVGLSVVALLPFGVFQLWLWSLFRQPGLSSGGAMATSFEMIPFMGLMRIGAYSLPYLLAMLLVFGPAIILPSLWGLWQSTRIPLTEARNVIVFGLIIHALAIAFLPFSTFREPGGLLRFACGLVLALLLFAARYRFRRVLNYSFLWWVLNVFLLKG